MNRKNDRLNLENSNKQVRGNDPSIACFLNSLARESQFIQIQRSEGRYIFQLSLSENRVIQIPLSYHSELGSHEYDLPALLLTEDAYHALSIEDLIDRVLPHCLN